jgi:pimeloyl-ACP methyl ester carboxylesterase
VHYALQSLQSDDASPPPPDHVWLLDTVPDVPDPTTRQVLAVVHKILQRDVVTTWPDVLDLLVDSDPPLSEALIEWLTMQWFQTERRFLFDAVIVEQLMEDITQAEADGESSSSSLWNRMDTVAAAMPLHLVQAGQNTAWQHKSQLKLRALQERHSLFTHHVLPNAGHWVHVDNLPGLIDIIASVHIPDEDVTTNANTK